MATRVVVASVVMAEAEDVVALAEVAEVTGDSAVVGIEMTMTAEDARRFARSRSAALVAAASAASTATTGIERN